MAYLLPSIGGFGGRWSFPRSYETGFATNWPSGAVETKAGRDWKIQLPPGYGDVYKHINFTSSFYAWSSNAYTLDHIFDDFEQVIDHTTSYPVEPVSVHYHYHPVTGKRYLALDVTFWTTWYYFDLPPPTLPYWRPTI